MEIRELDLETRNKIYSHTKSILRKGMQISNLVTIKYKNLF